ncbi:hypothetical protein [Nocardioides sp. Root151]|uniref:hypothetical protein n=1 Tax=Nocardioides sp. Root151 TaxID=1736475 RepID=UPI0007026E8F|nr:hypothetical protein [Nocardioides sp. Root151]KQZ75523.1 hypothetical protein ASD66_04020 [Nocardioides sp. Root151]
MGLSNFRHVIGYGLLVVLATAGGASASAIPGTNTVDSGDIINREVKAVDIAPGAVRSGTVLNHSLLGIDFKDNSVTGDAVREHSLNMASAGCQVGLVHSFTNLSGIPQDAIWRNADNGHNCSGGQILVRHTSAGNYQVQFVGDPAALGVAMPVSGYNSIGVTKSGDVFNLEQRNMDGTLVNNTISFVTY